MPDFQTPPTIAPGDAGEDVVLLQQFLIALEFQAGPEPSGVFDEDTSVAAAAFKASVGLTEDAFVDADTWAALFESAGPLPSDDMPTFFLDEFPALAQLLAFAPEGDIEGYVASPLDGV